MNVCTENDNGDKLCSDVFIVRSLDDSSLSTKKNELISHFQILHSNLTNPNINDVFVSLKYIYHFYVDNKKIFVKERINMSFFTDLFNEYDFGNVMLFILGINYENIDNDEELSRVYDISLKLIDELCNIPSLMREYFSSFVFTESLLNILINTKKHIYIIQCLLYRFIEYLDISTINNGLIIEKLVNNDRIFVDNKLIGYLLCLYQIILKKFSCNYQQVYNSLLRIFPSLISDESIKSGVFNLALDLLILILVESNNNNIYIETIFSHAKFVAEKWKSANYSQKFLMIQFFTIFLDKVKTQEAKDMVFSYIDIETILIFLEKRNLFIYQLLISGFSCNTYKWFNGHFQHFINILISDLQKEIVIIKENILDLIIIILKHSRPKILEYIDISVLIKIVVDLLCIDECYSSKCIKIVLLLKESCSQTDYIESLLQENKFYEYCVELRNCTNEQILELLDMI